MHTSATSHNALSRNGISAQLMNTGYSSCVSKCKRKIKQNTLSAIVDNRNGSNIRPPPNPNLWFMNYRCFVSYDCVV
ncbi:unnamed protein product, partial [Vitis vinifera]|uniref:Uncharacterized protein n=1 Tax=Vitis vinifera TaxID=29760 RepID=D7TVN0_VITVI